MYSGRAPPGSVECDHTYVGVLKCRRRCRREETIEGVKGCEQPQRKAPERHVVITGNHLLLAMKLRQKLLRTLKLRRAGTLSEVAADDDQVGFKIEQIVCQRVSDRRVFATEMQIGDVSDCGQGKTSVSGTNFFELIMATVLTGLL